LVDLGYASTVEPGYNDIVLHDTLAIASYPVVPFNSSLLTIILYSSVMELVYRDTKYSNPFHEVITQFDFVCVWCNCVTTYGKLLGVLYEVKKRIPYLEITCDVTLAAKPFVGFL